MSLLVKLTDLRTATFVVAASDSEHKYEADYKGDGINDQEAIQAAIDALPSGGGKVALLEGTFTKGNAAGITVPSNTEIEMSPGTTVKFADGIDADAQLFINSNPTGGNSNIIIKGGVLDGNRANQSAGIQCAIKFTKVSQSTIDCLIQNMRTQNVWEITPGEGNTIINRRIGARTEVHPFVNKVLGELRDDPPILGREIEVTTDNMGWFPSMTITPDGTFYVIYIKTNSHTAPLNSPLMLLKSLDMGATWTEVGTVWQDANYAPRAEQIQHIPTEDCLIAIISKTTTPTGEDFVNFTMKSYDGGVTWSSPVNLPAGYTDWTRPACEPIIKANGVMLLPVRGEDTGDTKESAAVYISDDCGDTWSFQRVADGEADGKSYQEPCVVEAQNGDIYMFSKYPAYHKSVDGGATWTGPTTISGYGFEASGRPYIIAPKSYDRLILAARMERQLGVRTLPVPPESEVVRNVLVSPIAFRTVGPAVGGTSGGYNRMIEVYPGCVACIYYYEYSSGAGDLRFCYIMYRSVVSPLGDPEIRYDQAGYSNLFEGGDFAKGIGSWITNSATVAEENTIVKIGGKSLKITGDGGSWPYAYREIDISTERPELLGKPATLGAWLYAPSTNISVHSLGVKLSGHTINVKTHCEGAVPRDDAWHWITTTKYIRSDTAKLEIWFFNLEPYASTQILYVGAIMLVEGTVCPPYTPRLASERTQIGVSDLFMDVLAASTNHCGSWVGTGAEQEITAGITQPDISRNLTVSCTNNATPSGDVMIEGIDAKGNSISEAFTIVPGGTATGNEAFATISKITIPATVDGGSADTVDVGIGSKLGLSNVINATGDVYKVKKNNADWAAANYTVNATCDTVDVSTGGAITGGDDFTIFYKSNLNIAS